MSDQYIKNSYQESVKQVVSYESRAKYKNIKVITNSE